MGQSSWFGEGGKRSAGWEGWRAVEPVGARISGELEGGRTQGWDARFGEMGAHLHLCALTTEPGRAAGRHSSSLELTRS